MGRLIDADAFKERIMKDLEEQRPNIESATLLKICEKVAELTCKEIDKMPTAKALGKDTNVPSNSALDHIHNVVRDDAYRRGYEQGKKDVPDMNVGKTEPSRESDTEITRCSNDTISRQAAIVETWRNPSYTDPLNVLTEVRDRIKALPPVQPGGWLEQNKDRILQAGKEGREVEVRIGGRLFAIREKAQ